MLKLFPAGKDYLWGGSRLRTEYHKKSDSTPLAETWECSVHPDGASRILHGRYAGHTLAEVISLHPEYLGEKFRAAADHVEHAFPILVKLIDAEKDLSIQVHPDDTYAACNEQQNGKTEMWYIIDAASNANVIYGFERRCTREEIRQAIGNHTLTQYLHHVPVHRGDVIYIPAGTVHAIGGGILLAEIQENSNLTYRVYDYDRTDKNGMQRELHIEKALQVMQRKPAPEVVAACDRSICHADGYSTELLCECAYFSTRKITVQDTFPFTVTADTFQVLLCLEGAALVMKNRLEYLAMQKGDCVFLPAGLGNCLVKGNVEFLQIVC